MNAKKYLNQVKEHLQDYQHIFEDYFEASSQVILFGSYATETFGHDSDIDVLFVCNKRKFKRNKIDFICRSEKQMQSKLWLGSELANHICKYGIWLKGKDTWTSTVFVSRTAIKRKKRVILNRMVDIYVKKDELSFGARARLFVNIYLDCYRLVLLVDSIPIPPKQILKEDAQRYGDVLLNMKRPNYLGSVGMEFFRELFPEGNVSELNSKMVNMIRE